MKRAPAATGRSLVSLNRKLVNLQKLNLELRNNIELKNGQIQNSLFSLIQGGEAQTAMGSINSLAYYNIYQPITINWTLLTYMYKTHGLLQTAIDMPVLDAMRGGFDLKSDQLSPDDMKRLHDRIEGSNIINVLTEAGSWTRLYGGGALVINTDQDPATPLNLKTVKRFELYPAGRWEVQSTNRYSEFYEFYGVKTHRSRVITMGGKPAPYLVKFVLQGWGMSEMERMIEPFNIFLRTKDVIYELLKEAKVDIYKFKHFTEQLATNAGLQLTQARLEQMNRAKTYLNALLLDAEDEYEQKQITFAGLAEMEVKNMLYVASSLRMPITKLFGISASGFNSGEDDIENYNAMVESEVRQPLRPLIREVLDLLCMVEFGDTFEMDFAYKPLRVMGAKEEEEVKTSKYNRFKGMYDDGLMDPVQYAKLLHSESLVPIETDAAKGVDPFAQPQKEHAQEMAESQEGGPGDEND